MIVYVTRPYNHEVVMGGWRHVLVWTSKPSFFHTPVGGYDPPRGGDPKETYRDLGWADKNHRHSGQVFKPLVDQDPVLEENAWSLLAWSCCANGVTFENWKEWANAYPEGTNVNEFSRDNWSNLLWHVNRDSDLTANVHYKRFLMEVNLRTNECKLVVPKVHIYLTGERGTLSDLIEETQDISRELMTRTNYACPEMDDDIPF